MDQEPPFSLFVQAHVNVSSKKSSILPIPSWKTFFIAVVMGLSVVLVIDYFLFFVSLYWSFLVSILAYGLN